jgi:hypothetical protein
MLAVAFDTLKLARKLESAGMQPKQAQDTSAALSESFTEWLSLGNTATREDLQKLEAVMREEIHELRAELKAEIGGVRTEIAGLEGKLEAKIEGTKAEILKWIFAQTVVLLATLFGLMHISAKF